MPGNPTSACAYDHTEVCHLPGHSDVMGNKRLITISPPIKSQPCLNISGLHGQQSINNFPNLLHSDNK